MEIIVTQSEVLRSAFTSEEFVNASVVLESDIAAVELRYLLPILGRELYDKLTVGAYTALRTGYVVPMVAAWTRYTIEPMLSQRCGICHSSDEVSRETLSRLRHIAKTYSRELTEYLNTHRAEFAEYNPDNNPLNRCSIDGNIVQIY